MSVDSPENPNQKFFHGEDINLYEPDAHAMVGNLTDALSQIQQRFRMVHFSGDGQMSLFPYNFTGSRGAAVPWDVLTMRKRGLKIAYTIGGCNDGQRQFLINQATGGACNSCVWQLRPDVCSENRSQYWRDLLGQMCDLISVETDWAVEGRATEKCFREPLTMCLDPEVWRPDLQVPERMRWKRAPGELIVFHAVGNYNSRSKDGRNIKGTGAVVAAIDRLRAEGINVRLEFVTGVPSSDVRFYQVQADVIVDQLVYGRYGATAREGMMLGKPTLCRVDPVDPAPAPRLRSLAETPLVLATTETVYDRLKELLLSAERRSNVGAASRSHAIKWFSADACAERYERVYDQIMLGGPVRDVPAFLQ